MKDISCEGVRTQLWMLLYGELSFDEEESVDRHLEGCGECREALERERRMHAAFDQAEAQPPASLLVESRRKLLDELEGANQTAFLPRAGWWDRFLDTAWLKPVGGLALVTVGFLGARLAPDLGLGITGMSLADAGAQRVRSVEPAADGGIQIVLDETRQRVVSGRLDDQNIRVLLLSAAKDASNPGLRYETVGILNDRAQAAEVRDILVYALEHDENAGVRLKAMDGNPGMRTQAIDLLTQGVGEGVSGSPLDRDMIGTLQELMNRENNAYVRQRGQRVLQLVNASAETY
jgi:hypothetical protein